MENPDQKRKTRKRLKKPDGEKEIPGEALGEDRKKSKHFFLKSRVGSIVLILLVLGTYGPVFQADFVWNDNQSVTENQALHSLDGLKRIWFKPDISSRYRPLTDTLFWVEYHLWGPNPFVYHLNNVILYALSMVLVGLLLRRLNVPGAWWGAALFALHPVHIGSVAWISERGYCLAGVFFFGALLMGESCFDPKQKRGYLLTLFLFACALLSSTSTSSLPLLFLLWFWWKKIKIQQHHIVRLIPFLLLSLFAWITTIGFEKRSLDPDVIEVDYSLLERFLITGKAFWFYLWKLIWPVNLMPIYPQWEIQTGIAWQYFFPFAALLFLFLLWSLRSRLTRGPFVGMACFTLLLIPTSAFFLRSFLNFSCVTDQFQYFAMLGPIVLIAAGIAKGAERINVQRWRIDWGVTAIILTLLGVLSWQQSKHYQTMETLCRYNILKNPDAWLAHNNLGQYLANQGDLEQATHYFRETLRINPNQKEALYNHAKILKIAGKPGEAEQRFTELIQLNPSDARAYTELGILNAEKGQRKEAIYYFQRALQITPMDASIPNHLGIVLAGEKRWEEAVQYFQRATEIQPDFAGAYNNLGMVDEELGRVDEAISAYRNALKYHPDWPKSALRLAQLLVTRKTYNDEEVNEAIGLVERIAEIEGQEHIVVLDTLAMTYAAAGRSVDAVDTGEKAHALARKNGQVDLAGQIAERVKLYKQNRRYIRAEFLKTP